MPDPSDAGAMLRWLRARIPPPLLERYRQPHAVSCCCHLLAAAAHSSWSDAMQLVQAFVLQVLPRALTLPPYLTHTAPGSRSARPRRQRPQSGCSSMKLR